MIETVIFDLDGTLIDTLGGIMKACNQVLTDNGYDTHEKGDYAGYVGNGLGRTLTSALPEGVDIDETTLNQMKQDFVKAYETDPLYDTAPYEGIEELLSTLARKGIVFGVHTNKHQHIAEIVFNHCFPEIDFIGLRGTSDVTAKKPDPQGSLQLLGDKINRESILYVGDTEVDIATARALGVEAVAVTWGFRDKEALESKSPDKLIDRPKDLIFYINQLNY